MNVLRERVAPVSPGIWPDGIGSWLDIYDDDLEAFYRRYDEDELLKDE